MEIVFLFLASLRLGAFALRFSTISCDPIVNPGRISSRCRIWNGQLRKIDGFWFSIPNAFGGNQSLDSSITPTKSYARNQSGLERELGFPKLGHFSIRVSWVNEVLFFLARGFRADILMRDVESDAFRTVFYHCHSPAERYGPKFGLRRTRFLSPFFESGVRCLQRLPRQVPSWNRSIWEQRPCRGATCWIFP